MRIIFLLIFSILFSYPLFAQKEDFQAINLPVELKDGADAIVRYDAVTVSVNSRRDLRVSKRAVVTVLNQAGNKHVIDHIYYSNSVKVDKAEAIIYNASGREIRKLRRRDFKDRSAVSGGTLYSDARYLYVDYTPTSYPYTLEISYEISFSNSFQLPNHYFINGFNVSTEKSSFTINYNFKDLSINYKESLLDEYGVSKTKSNGMLHYTVENLSAIRYEDYSPPFRQITPKVLVAPTSFIYGGMEGTVHNWNDFGSWFYNNLIAGRDKVSKRTLEDVKALVSGVEDELEKARIVYEYVQRNTRYISVQVGIGGMQPITAGDVDRVKYGDCKGLSNYTKVLLESVGITAYYTHIQSDEIQTDFEEDFASIEQGNHVILAIPHEGDYKWIECTSQTLPFGFIGQGNDNRKALLIKPDGGKIVNTQTFINEDNLRRTTADYQLDEQGNFEARVEIFNQGLVYSMYELERFNRNEQLRYYNNHLNRINNLRVVDFNFENDKDDVTFTENLTLEASNYGVINGDRMIFNINRLSDQIRVPARYRNRTHPVVNNRGSHYVDHFTIKIPENYEIESLPSSFINNTKYGNYSVLVKKIDENTISYSRNLLIRQGQYPKEEYEAFRDFLREVNIRDNAKVVLIKK
jgi:transglutaminase-like putative cysteine protease